MKKTIIGFLLFVILSASFYVMLPDKVRVDMSKTRSKYSVFEDGEYVLSAYEYLYIYDGTTKLRAKSREITSEVNGNTITIMRTANFKDNITTTQIYSYDGSLSNVESVPVKQFIECFNCKDKIVHFEYRNILYNGETKDIESPFYFGHSMKLEWQEGSYLSKVYQQKATDKIILRYKAEEDYETYLVRLSDPEAKNVSVSLCPNASSLIFRPDIASFNYTTGKVLEYNVSAYNTTGCNWTYNITNKGTEIINVTVQVNTTDINYTLWANNISVNTSPQRVYNDLAVNVSWYMNVTLSYLNATRSYPFQLNFSEE